MTSEKPAYQPMAFLDLQALVGVTKHPGGFTATDELKDRVEWIGWRWLLRAWGRALPLVMTEPAIRQSIREQFNWPPDVMRKLGYGLFAGRK